MSNIIKNKLIEVYNELTGSTANLNNSKTQIADALRFNGINNVSDNETFERYAELIKRLKSVNAMILEFSIPESATTAYKRTVVLPMYFGTNGNNGGSLNNIAKEIIASSPSTLEYIEHPIEQEDDEIQEHLITDVYGNTICDGNYTITFDDVAEYLPVEDAVEFVSAAARLSIPITNNISTLTSTDEFEPSTDAMYSYRVNWGDGSEECIYDHTKTYTENKSAIYHTYAQSGVYDVTINGTYKRIYTQGDDEPSFVENGVYVQDTDGTNLVNNNNYGMRNHLIAVIAWGNTLLTTMSNAFRACNKLASIPMYDTTNSFADVTTLSYGFRRCYALKELPFNVNTNTGLFSNCTKLTDISYCFSYCTGLTQPIPQYIIDGCTNLTNVQAMFAYNDSMTGSIPMGMFAGLTNLQNASEVFADCKQLDGEISDTLFADCPNITTIYRLFYNCNKLTGQLTKDVIGGLSKLTEMRQAFYNCKAITGITADAFYSLTADGINCRDAFYGSGIQVIPEGLLESLTGKNLKLERMFGNCTALTSVATSSLGNLKVANARGIFGGCTNLASACPTANEDWNTYEGMKRWYGAFAKTNLSDIDTVCLELGGDGNRKFNEGKVGAIVLNNRTYVDPKNYTYTSSNVPIGIVYADVYIDSSASTPTMANSKGNVVEASTSNAVHKIYATVLNDKIDKWTRDQIYCEDITSITNTSNVEVAYNQYTWNNDKTQATLSATRYNGEAYSTAINELRVAKGMATYTDGKYVKTDTDVYDAIDYANTYKQSNGGNTEGQCFLPDGADLWDQFTEKYLIQRACDAIISGGGGYNSSNCYSMRDGTYYWASAELNNQQAWVCYTSSAHVNAWKSKWGGSFVRPSLACSPS